MHGQPNIKIWISLTDFLKTLKYQVSWKTFWQKPSSPVRTNGRTDGETDMTKLTVAFRNFSNASKNSRNSLSIVPRFPKKNHCFFDMLQGFGFLSPFAKLRKRLIASSCRFVHVSVCLSVCLSTCSTARLPLDGLSRNMILFPKVYQEEQSFIRFCQNNTYFTWRPTNIYDHLFDTHVSVHHDIIYENYQQDATVYENLLFFGCSTCFERYFRSSSGASKLYYSFWYYTVCRRWPAATYVCNTRSCNTV